MTWNPRLVKTPVPMMLAMTMPHAVRNPILFLEGINWLPRDNSEGIRNCSFFRVTFFDAGELRKAPEIYMSLLTELSVIWWLSSINMSRLRRFSPQEQRWKRLSSRFGFSPATGKSRLPSAVIDRRYSTQRG